MKIHAKLTFLGSLAILSTSPLALAHKGVRHAVTLEAPTADVTDPATSEPVVVDGNTTDTTDPVDGTDAGKPDDGKTDGEVTGPKDDGTDVSVTDPGTPEDTTGDGTTVPLDWVKRGVGDNPDVIFYNMAGGPLPVFKGETSPVAKQIGPDGKATAIEGKENCVVPQISHEKKGAVALVKQGHVFLR